MENPQPPKILLSRSLYSRHAWRGVLFRFLVESQTYWSKETDGINVALRSFEQVWTILSYVEDPAKHINRSLLIGKSAAACWILCQLQYKGVSSYADPDLYDRFIARVPGWRPDPVEVEFLQATLISRHPSKLNALPAFEWLQRHYSANPRPIFLQQMLSKWTGFGFLIANAQILDKEGYKSEARWMLDTGRREMPDFFTMSNRRSKPSDHDKIGYYAEVDRRGGRRRLRHGGLQYAYEY